MIGIRCTTRTLALVIAAAAVFALPGPATAQAAEAPIKEVISNHIGWEVDKTTKGNTCSPAEECQPAKSSSEPSGLEYPNGVAVNEDPASPLFGDVYVADGDERVQVFTATGEFVLMFGREVNATTHGGICTEAEIKASDAKCKTGVQGTAAGQFNSPGSITVDPSTGDVYVQDVANWRVQEFTAAGEFVLMVGREVNETKDDTSGATVGEKNLCTAESKDRCKAGVPNVQGSTESGAFRSFGGFDELAVGGPEDLLYVGEEHRVQEFEADGRWKGEIPLTSISSEPGASVDALTVDNSCALHTPALTESTTPTCREFDPHYGDVYLLYGRSQNGADIIHQFSATGEETQDFEVDTREPQASVTSPIIIEAIAIDSDGRLAVNEHENLVFNVSLDRGSLYQVGATGLHLLTEFTDEFAAGGGTVSGRDISFNRGDELYATVNTTGVYEDGRVVSTIADEIVSYAPLPVGELSINPVVCEAGADGETDATVDCALNGEANPWGVAETNVSFQWGRSAALGSQTPEQAVATGSASVHVGAKLVGLLPNQTYYEQLVGYDHNVKPPESALGSERASFTTGAVPARVVGEPSVLFAGPSSAVMFGELNPENASTRYEFQYGACESLESCPGAASTPVTESSVYGVLGTTVEVMGLQPATVYRYRLLTEDESRGGSEKFLSRGPEGSFTTASTPAPQASTGPASAVGATSAVVSGTVDPDGQAAAYTFKLGVYDGAETQYGVVFSGSVAAGAAPVGESLALTGLQPGTTYAYKIAIRSGYIGSDGGVAEGEPVTFTTAGLPGVLSAPGTLAQLAVPGTAFPTASATPGGKAKAKPRKHKKAGKRVKARGHRRGGRRHGRGRSVAGHG